MKTEKSGLDKVKKRKNMLKVAARIASGARPSPGAAMLEHGTMHAFPKLTRRPNIAAPGEGRAQNLAELASEMILALPPLPRLIGRNRQRKEEERANPELEAASFG